MTKNSLNDVNWQDNSECAKPENKKVSKFFFSSKPEEKYAARNLCFSCDVRRECLKFALDNKQIHGVWGGKEEAEIRRALSVSHTGQEVRRQRFPNCPYCGARPSKLQVLVADAPDNGRWKTIKLVRCDVCTFTWKSRTSANAVNAYQASRKAKVKTVKPKAKAKPKKPSLPSTET